MKMNACPKYQHCNAPVCPLDDKWRKRVYFSEDPTCYYLLESVKEGSHRHFHGAQLEVLYESIVRVRGDIAEHFKRIGKKMESAKKTSSRMTRKITTIKEIV